MAASLPQSGIVIACSGIPKLIIGNGNSATAIPD